MAQKREIPAELRNQVFQQLQTQKASGGFNPSLDENFPVLKPFLDKQVIVYFPNVNVTEEEGKQVMGFVNSVRHGVRRSNYTEYLRCINGLEVEQLGWDGTCPLCEASSESWELYNHRVDKEAGRLGLASAKDDPNEVMKEFKRKVGQDRIVDSREAYVSYPVVVVERDSTGSPNMETAKCYIADMRKGRYDDLIDKALKQTLSKPDYPNGLFFLFDYTYDTKGKTPEPRDAGKNLTVTVIQDAAYLQILQPLQSQLEELAKPFTLEQINAVLRATQLNFKDEIDKLVDTAMQSTRLQLEVIRNGGQAALGGGPAPVGIGAPAPTQGNQLMNYGSPVPQQQIVQDPNFNPMLQGNAVPQQPMQNAVPQQPMQNAVPQQPMQNAVPQQPPVNNVPTGAPLGQGTVPQQPPVNGVPTGSPLGQGTVPQQPPVPNAPQQ